MNSGAVLPPRIARRLPVGAEVLSQGGVHFRVWAERSEFVSVVFVRGPDASPFAECRLQPEDEGFYSGVVDKAKPGDLYFFRLSGQDRLLPDPASRFQPHGMLGPSQVVAPAAFAWSDAAWKGIAPEDQVIYEMHLGTFTREGTFAAAANELDELAELGITVIEVMPVAEFPGRFGWGYDGVHLFAPAHLYGTPDDFRRFVDRAHVAGIAVILDVVYNHLGPSGQCLECYSAHYFTDRYTTDWGRAINFDGPGCGPVREFFVANAVYWIGEYHLDGLRLDATQSIHDASEDHILAAIARQARAAAGERRTILVAENEPQHTRLVRPPEQGGYGLDALWNDDFHHTARVALAGRNEAYYTDYRGTPQEFISAVKYGYLYQGQWYKWQKQRRGTPGLDLPPSSFVNYFQNHDQIANVPRALRCHHLTSPGRYRAMTALLLLAPGRPMLFQGQEFAASAPFCFFADHDPELARLVRKGRAQFLSQFPSMAAEEMAAHLPDPANSEVFDQCKLDFSERTLHADVYAMHRDLLRLRREDPVFHYVRRGRVDGAVLGLECFLLRFFGDEDDDRLLLVNFGADLHLTPAPEPLLAPPEKDRWRVLWSSENPLYGGSGTPPVETEEGWRIPGHAAIVLTVENP